MVKGKYLLSFCSAEKFIKRDVLFCIMPSRLIWCQDMSLISECINQVLRKSAIKFLIPIFGKNNIFYFPSIDNFVLMRVLISNFLY